MLAAALAAGATVKEAAKAAKMSERNARTLKRTAAVKGRVAELVAEVAARSVALAAFATLRPAQQEEVARLLLYPAARPA